MKAKSKALNDFDGLCLDCMDLSKPKSENSDHDYWLHDTFEEWDKGCRIEHGSSTWWFSFLGRYERREKHLKAMKDPYRHLRSYDSDSNSD